MRRTAGKTDPARVTALCKLSAHREERSLGPDGGGNQPQDAKRGEHVFFLWGGPGSQQKGKGPGKNLGKYGGKRRGKQPSTKPARTGFAGEEGGRKHWGKLARL